MALDRLPDVNESMTENLGKYRIVPEADLSRFQIPDLFLAVDSESGKPVVSGSEPGNIFNNVRFRKPETLSKINPSIDPEWDRIVAKGLAKKPGKRFHDIAELDSEIKATIGRSTRTLPTCKNGKN